MLAPETAGRVGLVLPAELSPAATEAVLAALGCRAGSEETLSLADYHLFLARLPAAVRGATEARWGAPEADPCFRPGATDCGRFVLPLRRFGALAAVLDAGWRPPRHGDLAAAAWLAGPFGAARLVLAGEAALPATGLPAVRVPAAPQAIRDACCSTPT